MWDVWRRTNWTGQSGREVSITIPMTLDDGKCLRRRRQLTERCMEDDAIADTARAVVVGGCDVDAVLDQWLQVVQCVMGACSR